MGVGMGLTALGKDGSDCVVEISLSPYPTPQGLVVIAAMREMTPKEIKNDSLEHENANLRDLLGLARNDVTVLLRQAGIEAIEREAAARFQRLLLEELHHRVKNMLATVTAITSQSLRNAKDVNQARSAIVSRLTAMGRAQDVLLRTAETGAHLGDVIREAIEPFESSADPRFVVQDVPIDIGPGAILPLTLSLNELCTNAVKYGALSNVAGRIAITIFIDEDTQLFTLRWMETGGPPVQQPAQYNFGTKLLGVLAAQLHGEIRLRYKPAGIDYQLKIPLSLIGVIRADADAPCQP